MQTPNYIVTVLVLSLGAIASGQQVFPPRNLLGEEVPAELRAKLWYKAFMRVGGTISQAQTAAVDRISGDLEQMKAIRQTYADARNAILDGWKQN